MQPGEKARQDFARKLREAREMRDLSQTALAKKAGLNASAIAHFEGGRRAPSFENIRVLARALDVSTDYLMGLPAVAFRDEHRLNAQNREFVQDMIETLLKKQEKKSE